MTKYKKYVEKMLEDNKAIFESFKKLHAEYALNPDFLQDKFNIEGERILEIVRVYEDRLCRNTEAGIYNKFSANLAEKFQNEVKKYFPMIDHVGLIVEVKPSADLKFSIKKINL